MFSLQNNTLSRADLSNETGVAKNVHYGDILTKFGEVLDISKEQLPMIMDEGVLTKYKTSFLQNGDVIITDTAEDTTVGKCSEIAGLNDEVVLSGLHTIPYRPIKKFASGYLGYYLNSSAYHNQLIPLMQGIKVTSISKAAMQDTDIVYPKPMEEQAMIGNYFQSLDHLITLHQRKRLGWLKVGKNDWEQRKLGELGSLKNGMNFSKEAMGIGFPFVNLQNIFGNNVIDVSNLGKAMASDSQLKDYNLLNGDVLFVRSSVKLEGVGEAALVPQTLDNTTYSGFIIRFRDEYGLDNNFKRFVFGIESVRNQIMSQATNSANKNISQSVLENLELAIPSKSEQQKIGAYFSNLDHLITLHQQK